MKRFLGFIFLLPLFVSLPAKADLLVEPVLGYSMGLHGTVNKGTSTSGGATISKDDFSGGSGPSFGGRLGYQKLGFQVGLDYLHSGINPSDKAFKGNLNIDEWAGFVGFEFPVLFRVYGGYIFSANGTGKYDPPGAGTSSKITLSSGTGFKAGLGFTLLPFLDINLEYRKGTFTTLKTAGYKFNTDVDYNVYMISLSLPFQL